MINYYNNSPITSVLNSVNSLIFFLLLLSDSRRVFISTEEVDGDPGKDKTEKIGIYIVKN